ncbi:TetR/AcrR family transcriptional regulator [Amycolatopsis magusensis]|nr:TetR/AcrR family transcriptional regulator [Amycolatopsis magusensis]MDI5976566.1 helix-turn-helix domain-containing protein [Amycolatopsis magusensis]
MRRDAARNRELVLAAAAKEFDQRGLDAEIRDIAKAAGVGVGTVYRHFPTKDDLVGAVLEKDLGEWPGIVERALAAEDAWAGLAGFLEQTLATMARHKAVLDGVTSAEASAAADACRSHLAEAVAPIVRRAHDEGSLRPEVTGQDLGLQILALGRIVELEPGGWRRQLGFVLDGLRAR